MFLWLSVLLAGVTDVHLRRLLIGLESKECCSFEWAAPGFPAMFFQQPNLLFLRWWGAVCRSRLLVLMLEWLLQAVTTVHRPEERPMHSQEFAISSGQRAVEMEQQNEAKGRECKRSTVKANTGVWMNQLLSCFCSCSIVEVTPLLSFWIFCRKSKGKPNGKKPAPEEKKLYLEPEYTKSRITDFEFKELVMLPREIDLNEWLASNSEYCVHTALSLLSTLERPFIHSFAVFSA